MGNLNWHLIETRNIYILKTFFRLNFKFSKIPDFVIARLIQDLSQADCSPLAVGI